WWATAGEMNRALADYRFDEAATAIYDFFWKDFCDWYIELIKGRLNSSDVQEQKLALFTAMGVLEGSLRLLHPIMPFITEELFHAIYEGKPPKRSIALVGFPRANTNEIDKVAEREMALLQSLITHIRELRAEAGVPPKGAARIAANAHGDAGRVITANRGAIERLANVSEITNELPEQRPWTRSTPEYDVVLLYERQVDV